MTAMGIHRCAGMLGRLTLFAATAIILSWTLPSRPAIAAQTPIIVATSPDEVGLANHLSVHFEGLDQPGLDPLTLRLCINEHRFPNVAPDRIGPNELRFDMSALRKDPDGGWLALAGSPPFIGRRTVTLAISAPGMEIHGRDNAIPHLQLRIFDPWLLVLAACVFVIIMTIVFLLAVKTTILRDTTGGLTHDTNPKAPYSLSKCQMAFWFSLILAGFLGLWVVTGDFNNIVTAQSLTLLGISSVTGLGAIAIDNARNPARQTAATNAATVPNPPPVPAPAAPSGTSAPAVSAVATPNPPANPPPVLAPPGHLGFWKDILTDDSGWAFHRLQITIWTFVLGIVGVYAAFSNLALPTFDPNLLILMGISSGLYLGLKYPEQQTDKPLPA
jgi:hypothetical protein